MAVDDQSLLQPGANFGQYRIVRLLGRGGMGEVFEVVHTTLGGHFAMKLLQPVVLQQPGALERFKSEAKAMYALRHANILHVDDFDETDGLAWLRMELADGVALPAGITAADGGSRAVSLLDLMRAYQVSAASTGKPGRIPEAQVGSLLRQLLEGLAHAHDKGVIHRDIKPANLLFSDGLLKLSDFGLVHLAGDDWLQTQYQRSLSVDAMRQQMAEGATIQVPVSSSGPATPRTSITGASEASAILGTFEYMSPESRNGQTLADARGDLFAVGKIAYQILTGEREIGFKTPSRLAPGIHNGWDAWVERATEPKPAERFQSAREMLEAMPRLGAAPTPPPVPKVVATPPPIPAPVVTPPPLAPAPAPISAPPPPPPPAPTAKTAEAVPAKPKKSGGNGLVVALVLVVLAVAGGAFFLLQPGADDGPPADPVVTEDPAPTPPKVEVPTAATGRLIVRTSPMGATVAVGGQQATSPAVLNDLPAGEQTYTISLPGYVTRQGSIAVGRGQTADPGVIQLERARGSIVAESTPAGLPFRLVPINAPEGESQSGTTPKLVSKLPTGSWRLEVDREGWGTQTTDVKIDQQGEIIQASVAFKGASLRVASNPSWAQVLQGDQPLGTTPLTLTDLAPGEQTFTVRKAGYRPKTVVARLTAGNVYTAEATLEPLPPPATGKNFSLPLPDGSMLELVFVAPGKFYRGSAAAEPGRDADEVLAQVTMTKGFWLGQYEVTQAQWKAVMGSNPSQFPNAGPDAPVERITWEQANEFCRKLTEQERQAGRLPSGYVYALPTEAQWEYAARAGTTEMTYAGDLTLRGKNDSPQLDPIAWYGGNSGVTYAGGADSRGWAEKQYPHTSAGTHPVGQKTANAWGFYDMLGNVWEWCDDWKADYAQPRFLQALSDPVGPATGTHRIIRGGSWYDHPQFARAANRNWAKPEDANGTVGFRLALRPAPAK